MTAYSKVKPRAISPADPLAPETTVYWDQSTGAQQPGAGGPMLASRVWYDNAQSGMVADTVQGAIDLMANQIANIIGPSGLEPRVDALETEMDAAQADIDAAEANIVNLQGRMTTAEVDIDNLETRTTTAEGEIDTAQADIIALDGRMDAAEASIVTLQGRVTAAEADIDALQAADVAIDGRLDAAEASITNLQGRMTTVEGKTGPALEATAGIAEIATQAETTTGTDDARIVTPLKLAQRIAALNLASTYVDVAGDTMSGDLTISKANATLAVISTNAANSAIRYGVSNVVRAEIGYEASNARLFVNINDAAGAYLGTPLSVLATRIGVNALPPASITLHVQSTGDAWQQVQAGTAIAGLALKNNARTYDLRVSTSLLELWDNTASRRLLHIDATGAWIINPRSDGYGSLMVQGTTNPAILYFGHSTRQYHIENDGSSLVFKDDTAGGANRMWFDASGNCTITGPIYASNGLRGAEGDAGRLKCYNGGNHVTFEWTGTQLYGRIDNGAARVLLG